MNEREEQPLDLDQTWMFRLPWSQDPWGIPRPALTPEAVRMSARLASDTYDLSPQAWMDAGWTDVTLQIGKSLMTMREQESQNPLEKLTESVKRHFVTSTLRGKNPIGQVAGVIQSKDEAESGKAMVMAHAAPDGHTVIAISFMGTGLQLGDWIGNLRMTVDEGCHRGFLELTRLFERNEAAIELPETAKRLGLDKLTLRDVIDRVRQGDERFTFWLCGHSQGAAVLQLWCMRKIGLEQVPPRAIIGFGFAPPTVCMARLLQKPGALPIYGMINADDLVPRSGCETHLGLLLRYPGSEEQRAACYAPVKDEQAAHAMEVAAELAAHIVDMRTCAEVSIALLRVLMSLAPDDLLVAMSLIGSTKRGVAARVSAAAGNQVVRLLRYLERHVAAGHRTIYGKPCDEGRILRNMTLIQAKAEAVGLRPLMQAISQYMMQTHSCKPVDGARMGTYPWIAAYGLDACELLLPIGGSRPHWLRARYSGCGLRHPPHRHQPKRNRRPLPGRPRTERRFKG